ncbi:MAG: DUF2752 domain-containing protein [Bacteroidales bacterium]|jgi:hypothetical protein|nr:DUF2752 domain-containing protein [Bacteroidales bacterium]
MVLTSLITIVDWLESKQLPCLTKSIFHIECPGCGMQRALIALLRGDLAESLRLHPGAIPTLAMLMFLTVHLVFKLKNGSRILLYLFSFNVFVIIVNYIIKIIFKIS